MKFKFQSITELSVIKLTYLLFNHKLRFTDKRRGSRILTDYRQNSKILTYIEHGNSSLLYKHNEV